MIISGSKTVETQLVNLVVVDSSVCSRDGCIWMHLDDYMPISPANSTRLVVQQRQATVHKLTLIERDIDVHIYIAFGADN